MKTRFLLICMIFMSLAVKSQVGTALTVGLALDHMEQKARNIMGNAEYRFNSAANNATASVLHVIGDFRDKYADMLDMTVEALEGEMKTLFDGIQTQVDDIFLKIENANDNIDASIDNLALHLGSTWVGNKDPRITKVSIPFIIKEVDKTIVVAFKGVFLSNKKNHLVIGNKVFKPYERNDKNLKFILPANSFDIFNNSQEYQTIKLNIYKKKLFKNNQIENTFMVKSLPKDIGTFVINYDIVEEKRITQSRSANVGCDTRGGFRSRNPCGSSDVFSPMSGYKIDLGTINLNTRVTGGQCHQCGASKSNVSEYAFTVNVEASARRKKGKLCRCWCHVTWTDYKYEKETVTKSTDNYNIVYGIDSGINLPKDIKNFVNAELTLYDGKKILFTRTGTINGIRLEFDNVTKFMKVSTEF